MTNKDVLAEPWRPSFCLGRSHDLDALIQSSLLHTATCLMPIEKSAGAGRGPRILQTRGRSSGDEPRKATTGRDKSFARCKDANDGEETEGGASPLKLYLGQILLAAANLSSAAHTNHSGGSSRRQHQSLRDPTGGGGREAPPAGIDARWAQGGSQRSQ